MKVPASEIAEFDERV